MKGVIITIVGIIMVLLLIVGIFIVATSPIFRTNIGKVFRWPYEKREEVSLRQIGTSAIYVIKTIVMIVVIIAYVFGACLMATYCLVEHKKKGN